MSPLSGHLPSQAGRPRPPALELEPVIQAASQELR